jgi:hypothetical protein
MVHDVDTGKLIYDNAIVAPASIVVTFTGFLRLGPAGAQFNGGSFTLTPAGAYGYRWTGTIGSAATEITVAKYGPVGLLASVSRLGRLTPFVRCPAEIQLYDRGPYACSSSWSLDPHVSFIYGSYDFVSKTTIKPPFGDVGSASEVTSVVVSAA